MIEALVKSGTICRQATQATNTSTTGRPSKKKNWKQIQYYCYTHGANTSHFSKDYKNPLGDYQNKSDALRCDTQGGITKNLDKWKYWMCKDKFRKEKPD